MTSRDPGMMGRPIVKSPKQASESKHALRLREVAALESIAALLEKISKAIDSNVPLGR